VGFLRDLGLLFESVAPDVDETAPEGINPAQLVAELARAKAHAVADRFEDALIIAADTVVSIDNQILGKPSDRDHARDMLHQLAGRTHEVHTGLALLDPAQDIELVEVCRTEVTMVPAGRAAIERYIDSGEPMDKAGAYGIQGLGGLLIELVTGCYSTVAGLPVCRLSELLVELDVRGAKVIRCGEAPDRIPPLIAQRLSF
jgi:septum formation protein